MTISLIIKPVKLSSINLSALGTLRITSTLNTDRGMRRVFKGTYFASSFFRNSNGIAIRYGVSKSFSILEISAAQNQD